MSDGDCAQSATSYFFGPSSPESEYSLLGSGKSIHSSGAAGLLGPAAGAVGAGRVALGFVPSVSLSLPAAAFSLPLIDAGTAFEDLSPRVDVEPCFVSVLALRAGAGLGFAIFGRGAAGFFSFGAGLGSSTTTF
jgi:hypothetical protein